MPGCPRPGHRYVRPGSMATCFSGRRTGGRTAASRNFEGVRGIGTSRKEVIAMKTIQLAITPSEARKVARNFHRAAKVAQAEQGPSRLIYVVVEKDPLGDGPECLSITVDGSFSALGDDD